MSKYSSLPKDSPPEQKLAVVTNEALVPITTIQGHALMIKRQVTKDSVQGLPDDFDVWIDAIIAAADDLYELRKWALD